jgi:hypothetical protein
MGQRKQPSLSKAPGPVGLPQGRIYRQVDKGKRLSLLVQPYRNSVLITAKLVPELSPDAPVSKGVVFWRVSCRVEF